MPLNFNDVKNDFTTNIKNNSIIKMLFGNIFTTALIITVIIFFIVINNIIIDKNEDDEIIYSYNTISIILYSLIVSILALSMHDKLIKEEYNEKNKSKSAIEFADMMTGSADTLINNKVNVDKFEDDIERFLNKN